MTAIGGTGPGRPARPVDRRRRRKTRMAFYAHLWLGVVFTVALTGIAITGILLNHKRGLGLMPDVAHEPTGAFTSSLSIDSLAAIGAAAAAQATGAEPPAPDRLIASVDRMDVRPRDGFVKVRMRDASSTEATVDIATGRVLHVGPRGDAFLEKVHSGEIFGDGWVLLSDAAAVALVITLVTGVWLWLAPKLRRPGPGAVEGGVPAAGDD